MRKVIVCEEYQIAEEIENIHSDERIEDVKICSFDGTKCRKFLIIITFK